MAAQRSAAAEEHDSLQEEIEQLRYSAFASESCSKGQSAVLLHSAEQQLTTMTACTGRSNDSGK